MREGRIVCHSVQLRAARGRMLNPNTVSVMIGRMVEKVSPALRRAMNRAWNGCLGSINRFRWYVSMR